MAKYETKVLQPETKIYNMTFPATTCGITEIKVYPQVEGLVTKKNYTPGTIVQKGQTLFVIDPTEYQLSVQSAEADLKVANANLETTRLQYESNQKLHEKKIISDYVLNTSLNEYNSAQATVSQAQAQLNIARTNLGYCTVTSPVTGYIAGNEFNVGDMVSRARYLCTVSDISYQTTQIQEFGGPIIAFTNTALFNKNFKNLTRGSEYVYTKVNIGVSYNADVDKIRELLLEASKQLLTKDEYGRDVVDPRWGISVDISDFADSRIIIAMKQSVLVEKRFGYIKRAKALIYKTFRENGITIPFDQLDVHVIADDKKTIADDENILVDDENKI